MKINVLGTTYNLEERKKAEDYSLLNGADGYCDTSIKKMIVDDMREQWPGMKENISDYQASVKRHEIIHGFLYESGLDACCNWACEEMVDWLAIQFPKLKTAFEKANAL